MCEYLIVVTIVTKIRFNCKMLYNLSKDEHVYVDLIHHPWFSW